MLNLKCRTEYSFRTAYGRPEEVMAQGGVGICDRSSTWGHVQFAKVAKKKGIKPVFGVELAVVKNHEEKEKQPINWMSFLARNNDGLKEIYKLTSLATKQMYYVPRISYSQLWDISDNIYILSGAMPLVGELPRVENLLIELSPLMEQSMFLKLVKKGYKPIAVSDNYYPTPEDRESYEILASSNKDDRTTPMHILDEWQWKDAIPWAPEEAIVRTKEVYDECNAVLPTAEMVHYPADKSLREMCILGAARRGVRLDDPAYSERMDRELELIAEKKFEDYFYVIADMVNYAKEHMLVGPARGSSCGSLVCYLLGITDIDPLPYDLLFERFIDINREDLPDIDIDFQDDRREMVFEYLRTKYGSDKVARLGTVMRYKAKSAIDDVARELQIPAWEVKDLKGAIIERSSGDSRAQFCILDTFEGLEVGKQALEKFPGLRVSASLEGHARQSGQHAAGVLVTDKPIETYCSVDHKTGAVMIDKKDAEDLNLLKIDALGLRTLSVLQDVLDNVGWTREQLLAHPLDDEKAFDVLRRGSYSGIFQFEGFALQNICRQMPIRQFEDIAAITALARPGPLNSGGTAEYVKRHNGIKETKYIHPLLEEYTKETHGIFVYQEQIMQVARNVGNLSWEDVSTLRKAMSKSLGKEYFDQFKVRFVAGAIKNGLQKEDSEKIWDDMCTFGAWGFNLSHAIAYAMVSYWCCVLKAQFPLEYAAACLRNSKDEEQVILLIRELVRENYKYKPFDKEHSIENWSVKDGVLIGGLTNLNGIGEKMAADIIKRRASGIPLTARQAKLMDDPKTPYDHIFEAHELWGDLYENWENNKISRKPTEIGEINDDVDGHYVVIGKLMTKNLRDLNEVMNVQKRGGIIYENNTQELLFSLSDDTGKIRCKVGRFKFEQLGKPIVEEGKLGDWYLVLGKVRKGFLSLNVEKWRKLERK